MDFVLFFYQLIRDKRTFATAVMSLPVRQLKLKFNYIYKFYLRNTINKIYKIYEINTL